jgi:hypothetical protein
VGGRPLRCGPGPGAVDIDDRDVCTGAGQGVCDRRTDAAAAAANHKGPQARHYAMPVRHLPSFLVVPTAVDRAIVSRSGP